MIGLKPTIGGSSKFLEAESEVYRLPPHLDRLRMYLSPVRLIGGGDDLEGEGGPSGLQQFQCGGSLNDREENLTQKSGSNEDNNCSACGAKGTTDDDDDEEDECDRCVARGNIKVTHPMRTFSTPHERESLLSTSGALSHSASLHLCKFGGRKATTATKRFGNDYYHSVENVVGDDDIRNNFNHHTNHTVVLPTASFVSASASKSPSCRCCPNSTASIPSSSRSSSSIVVANPLQPQHDETNRCSDNGSLLGVTSGMGCGGRLGGGDKLNIILDETGTPMLVNQCDNRLLLLQTSASLPEMQMRSMGAANGVPQPKQHHHTTVEVHDGRHVVLAMGDESDGCDGRGGGGSMGCLPMAMRHEDTKV